MLTSYHFHFQLTPIAGDAALYSTKKNSSNSAEFPSKDNFGKFACFCAHIITYCGFNPDDKPLAGTYYLAAYGLTHATFTVTAIARSSIEPSAIQLMEGVPHKFVFPEDWTFASSCLVQIHW